MRSKVSRSFLISICWIKLDTIVIVVILTQEGLVSSGRPFRISSRVRRYEKLLLAIDEYMVFIFGGGSLRFTFYTTIFFRLTSSHRGITLFTFLTIHYLPTFISCSCGVIVNFSKIKSSTTRFPCFWSVA